MVLYPGASNNGVLLATLALNMSGVSDSWISETVGPTTAWKLWPLVGKHKYCQCTIQLGMGD